MRSHTPEYMREGYVSEETRRAGSRLSPHLKVVDGILIRWAKEYDRYEGAPDMPKKTLLKRIIEQTALGASQQGRRVVLPMEAAVELADLAIAGLREIHRRVIVIEYVLCVDKPPNEKHRRAKLSSDRWFETLKEARECVNAVVRMYAAAMSES